jgi:hypothetical protein
MSIVALAVSVATFIWTRIDKWRDRRSLGKLREPIINVGIQGVPGSGDRWTVSFTIVNRCDFDIQLEVLSVPDTFSINFGNGNGALSRHELRRYIVRAEQYAFSGSLARVSGNGAKLRFAFEITELGPKPRQLRYRIRRKLS